MKIAVVCPQEESFWQSCRSITGGLREAYSQLSGCEVREFTLPFIPSVPHLLMIADDIGGFVPDLIVFLDTFPAYGTIVKRLSARYRVSSAKRSSPVFRFHVYGDFTLRAYQWQHWGADLVGFKVEWACASEKQRKLVESSLQRNANATWICPFPVAVEKFKFSHSSRLKTRKQLKLTSKTKVALYSGRLSLQKNIGALLRTFAALDHSDPYLLIIAGEMDDLGAPVGDVRISRGGYQKILEAETMHLPLNVRQRIKFLRGLSQGELRGLYNASDVFISASLQHDEDFGMAPAEAFVSGLPLVLTDWGGYSHFRKHGAVGNWVPVELTESGAAFQIRELANALQEAFNATHSIEMRKKLSKRAEKALSVASVTKAIKQRNSSEQPKAFTGFKEVVEELAKLFSGDPGHLIFQKFEQGSVYEQVYKNYV